MSTNNKFKCEGCGKEKRSRKVIFFKGKWLCHNCRNKSPSFKLQLSASLIGKPIISIEKALEKTYTAKLYIYGGSKKCYTSLPSVLAEKKFKIILVEE